MKDKQKQLRIQKANSKHNTSQHQQAKKNWVIITVELFFGDSVFDCVFSFHFFAKC